MISKRFSYLVGKPLDSNGFLLVAGQKNKQNKQKNTHYFNKKLVSDLKMGPVKHIVHSK